MELTQKSLLEALNKYFELDETEAELVSDGNSETLLVSHPDIGENGEPVLGRYSFAPAVELKGMDARPMDFVIELLFPAQIQPECVSALRMAAIDAGVILPRGAFEVSPDDEEIFYRRTVTLWSNTDATETLQQVAYEITRALLLCAVWLNPFVDLAEGDLTYEEMLDYMDFVAQNGSLPGGEPENT